MKKLTLLCDFLWVRVGPLVLVSAANWRLVWDLHVVVRGSGAVPVFFKLDQVGGVILIHQFVTLDRLDLLLLKVGKSLGARVN